MLILCSETPTCLYHLTPIPAQSRVEQSQKACRVEFLFSWLNIDLFEVWWILNQHKCAFICELSTIFTVLLLFPFVLSWNICWNQIWWKNAEVHCCCIRFSVTFWVFKLPWSIYIKSKCFLCAILWHSHIFPCFFFSCIRPQETWHISQSSTHLLSDKKTSRWCWNEEMLLDFLKQGENCFFFWLTCSWIKVTAFASEIKAYVCAWFQLFTH